jgi:hypothetical protein
MTALSVALFVVALPWLLWYAYILVMGLYRVHLCGELRGVPRALAWPAVVVGFCMDWLANCTVAWLWFRDPPRELGELVTARLARYIRGPAGWRQRQAQWICDHLLDPFDPSGDHCK